MKLLTDNQITDLVFILIDIHGSSLSECELTDRILDLLEDISGFEFINDHDVHHVISTIRGKYHVTTTTENHRS